jgi:hypothetical protein
VIGTVFFGAAPGSTQAQVRTQFPGNIIPTNRINPIAKKVLDYYSLPKNPGVNGATGPAGNIYDATLPEKTKAYDTLTGKVDHNISAHNKMFARGSWYERNSHYNDYLASAASGTLFQFISWQAVVDDVHVFNPTTVLNVRYGYNRFDRNSDMEKPSSSSSAVTFSGSGFIGLLLDAWSNFAVTILTNRDVFLSARSEHTF